MANNLRVFNTNSEYQSADLILPSVSYVVETDKVIYDYTPPTPPTPSIKWKATYSDSHTESAECDSSSELTYDEIIKDSLVSVEIGNCVTSIGTYAFTNSNSLTSITIPDSVTEIGQYAFGFCMSLASIDIPNSVTSIISNAFYNDVGLTSVTIGSGITSIGDRAFQNCDSLTGVTINATTPPTLGGSNVFENTNKCPIYVPSASVNAYKRATNWSNYASRIQPIS